VRGFLDPIPLDKVTSFEEKLRAELKANGQEILEAIRTEREISESTEEKLKAFMESFSKTFV
jgi:F-type H+-transporting ATPase subunit alpha